MQIQLVPCALSQKVFSSSCFSVIWKTAIRKSGNILYAIHTHIGNISSALIVPIYFIVRYLAELKYIAYTLFHNDFTIISINGDYKT